MSRHWTRFARVGQAGVAAALGFTLSACAGAPVVPTGTQYVFKVTFDANGCPQGATLQGGAPDSACDATGPVVGGKGAARTSCLKAARNDTVTFQGDQGSPSFSVVFDPFAPPLTTSGGQSSISKRIHPQAIYTVYKFSIAVASDTCPVLDPIIVVGH
jgi:hypothetical protein